MYDLGITFDFADQTIDIGNMGLKIFTRSDAEEEFYGEDWSKKSSWNILLGLPFKC